METATGLEKQQDGAVEIDEEELRKSERTKQLLNYIHQGRSVKQFRADEKIIKKSNQFQPFINIAKANIITEQNIVFLSEEQLIELV